MMGQTLNQHYTTVTDRDCLQYGDKGRRSIEEVWFLGDIGHTLNQ